MKMKSFIKVYLLFILLIFVLSSCTPREKTIEDYNISEVLDLANNDYNNTVKNSDCDYLSTIDISKAWGETELSILIDKRTLYDNDTTNSHIIKNNMIKYDGNDEADENIILDYDQEEYRVLDNDNIVYYQKSIKNEIYFPWDKYIVNSKLMDDKNNIVSHLFSLVNGKDFIIEKLNKDTANNSILTLKGKLNSIELLDNLSTEFINSNTSFLNDIDFDVQVVINEIDKGYRYKSIMLTGLTDNQHMRFNINASFELKDVEVYVLDEVINCMDKEISYDEYLQSALIDSDNTKDIYDKLYSFTNEFYSLYNKDNFITGRVAKDKGIELLTSKQGKYFDVRDKVFAYDDYWDKKAKAVGSNKDECINNVKNMFSGNLFGSKAIDQYKNDPATFAFDTNVESAIYKIGVYSDLSMDCEDKYGFPIFERNYECISIYTNQLGIKAYEFKAKEDRNDIYKYMTIIDNTNYYNEYKHYMLIIKFSDIQGEHYFDGKEAFHCLIFATEDATENSYKYVIDTMFDLYEKDNYDIILNKVSEVLDNN